MAINRKNRSGWSNDVNNQQVDPIAYYTPDTLEDIVSIVRQAEQDKVTVRAVGSGHSFSDVVQTTGYLINTDSLNKPLQLEPARLKEGRYGKHLVEVEAGMKIHTLNDYLDKNELALINMGAYDGQSIAGATSTSTHGSGLQFGPLASFYKSVLIVAAGGVKYRIEPSDGITDPTQHFIMHGSDVILKQDDEWFNTVVISMGCTGIFYSVIIEVTDKYWLTETRYTCSWPEAKAKLADGTFKNDPTLRHFEVLINPYIVNGTRLCLVTERRLAPPVKGRRRRRKGRSIPHGNFMPIIMLFIDYVFNRFSQFLPWFINWAMKSLVDSNYIDLSYHVLNLGAGNLVSAYSSELAFSMEDKYLEDMEQVIELAEKMKKLGRIYHTSPISMRFVKASGAYFSMMNGHDTCMLEIPVVNHTYGGFELLQNYEEMAMKVGARLHWGQYNTISGAKYPMCGSYPQFETWNKVYRQLNSKGTFNNSFTDRFGLSV